MRSRVITSVTPTTTECSFHVAIICWQIKYPVWQQQLANKNRCEFPLSSRSHSAQPAPRAIKHHKTHHSRQKNSVYLQSRPSSLLYQPGTLAQTHQK